MHAGGRGKWVAGTGTVSAAKGQEWQRIRRRDGAVERRERRGTVACLIRSFLFSQGTISFHCVHFYLLVSVAGTNLSWTHCRCMLTALTGLDKASCRRFASL